MISFRNVAELDSISDASLKQALNVQHLSGRLFSIGRSLTTWLGEFWCIFFFASSFHPVDGSMGHSFPVSPPLASGTNSA